MSGYPGYPPSGYPPQQGGYPPGYPPPQQQGGFPPGYPPQGAAPPGYPPQGAPPGYPPQPGYPPAGYPPAGAPSGYPPPGGYPPQPGYPPNPQQGYPPQSGYPPQPQQPGGYPPQPVYPPQPGYPQQPGAAGYPPQPVPGYPPQGYPPTGAPPAGYPPAGAPQPGGYPPTGAPPAGYPPAGAPQPGGYPPQPVPGGYPPAGAVPVVPKAPEKPLLSNNPDKDADELRTAMKGLGTDEKKLIAIICNRTHHEIQAIKASYLSKYGKDLSAAIKSETSGHFEKVLVAALKDPRQYDSDILFEAMKGLGTDEDTLILFLTGRDGVQKEKIKEIYARDHGKSLETAVASETSGDLKKLCVGLSQVRVADHTDISPDNVRADAERLYSAGEGKIGTDEAAFIEIFSRRSWPNLRQIFQFYETIHKHHTMDRVIDSEFSGHLKRGLAGIVVYARNPGEFWADALYNTMKGAGTKDDALIRLVVANRDRIQEIKQAFSGKYHKSLWQSINSETSGDYKHALLTIIGN